MTTTAAEIHKWTDINGQLHYGQIPPSYAETTKVEINSSAPKITKGESQRRQADDRYFSELYERRKQAAALGKKRAEAEKKKRAAVERRKAKDEKARASRCDFHKKKISEYEDKLRRGYSASQGARYHEKKYTHEAQFRKNCR